MKKGLARGTAILETKSDLQAMAVRGLQSGQLQAALERSYRRWKFSQACSRLHVVVPPARPLVLPASSRAQRLSRCVLPVVCLTLMQRPQRERRLQRAGLSMGSDTGAFIS